VAEHAHQVQEVYVLPTSAVVDDDWDLITCYFAVSVQWRGPVASNGQGGWAVKHFSAELSRRGKWGYPEKFQRRAYRWHTQEEATAAAEKAVDSVVVNGRTYAEAIGARKEALNA
jgi:hypothetical protein